MRRVVVNAAWFGAAQVVGKVATLAWTLLAARRLSEQDFGSFAFALSLALLAGSVAKWGFDSVLVLRVARDRDGAARYVSEAVAWQLLAGLPVMALAAVASLPTRPNAAAGAAVVLLTAGVYAELWSETARAAGAALGEQRHTSAALVAQRLLTGVLAVPVLLLGGGLVGLALVFLGSSVVGLGLHVVGARRAGAVARRRLVTRDGLRDFARGSAPIGVASLVLMALFRLDALLLAAIHDDVAVAAYAAAYRLFETMLFAAQALRSSVFPVMSARADGETARRAVERFAAATALVYVPFGVVCAIEAPRLLALLYGERYAAASAGALRWLAAAPLVWGLSYVANGAAQALGRARVMLLGAVVATIVNVVLNLTLIPRWAGTGAAAATTVSYVVLVAVVLVSLRPLTGGVRLPRALAEPAAGAAAAAAVLGLVRAPVLVEAALATAAYLVVWAATVRRTDPQQLRVLRALVRPT